MFDTSYAKNVELKTLELFQEDGGRHYLKAVYQYETNRGVYELVIPKMLLPVMCNSLPKIVHEGSFCYAVMANIGIGDLEAIKTTCPETGSDSNVNYYVKTIKEKTQTLTLQEIEQLLGYKVNLVSEKKD